MKLIWSVASVEIIKSDKVYRYLYSWYKKQSSFMEIFLSILLYSPSNLWNMNKRNIYFYVVCYICMQNQTNYILNSFEST